LGVEEWRIPVGRAETTRKGEGEEEGVADGNCGNDARKREREEGDCIRTAVTVTALGFS
jgi:hypothetical protein